MKFRFSTSGKAFNPVYALAQHASSGDAAPCENEILYESMACFAHPDGAPSYSILSFPSLCDSSSSGTNLNLKVDATA